jgi:hypothetical protein
MLMTRLRSLDRLAVSRIATAGMDVIAQKQQIDDVRAGADIAVMIDQCERAVRGDLNVVREHAGGLA